LKKERRKKKEKNKRKVESEKNKGFHHLNSLGPLRAFKGARAP
jgi:hypothetical protein